MLARFTPDMVVQAVYEIPLERMEKAGLHGFLFDLDNTLLAHYDRTVEPKVVEWLEKARKRGFRLAMVTNAPPRRALPLADQLDMPCIYRARKPLRRGVLAGIELLNLPPAQVAMVGDQLFTDIWAGRRVGTYTIWVRPPKLEEPLHIGVKRPVEWLITRLVRLPEHDGKDSHPHQA